MNQQNKPSHLDHDPMAHAPGRGGTWWRYMLLLALLYVFLIAIRMLGKGISGFGEGFTEGMLAGVENPFAGLAAGILFTVLVQSSSVTTSTIVALVGVGTLTVNAAVPMIMGANIGTTITNTLVSIGHVRRGNEFRRAFAAATIHDFFNLIAVCVMLPLEISTGFLSKMAHSIAGSLAVGGGATYKSPIKSAVKAGEGLLNDLMKNIGMTDNVLATGKLIIGLGLIFTALALITRTMRVVIAHRAERALNNSLKKSAIFAISMGAMITMAVQSSSITTSLLVPMCGSGSLSLEAAFPVMLGANIGTTITAFLASLATGQNGLEIAIVHMLFNLIGTAGVFMIPAVRKIPIKLAQGLAVRAVRQKLWVIAYVCMVFIAIPVLGILIF